MNEPEQPAGTGAGPLFERRYCIDIARPRHSPKQLMEDIRCNIEHFSPDLLAEFEKVKGEAHRLEVGDEFKIRILGPWNGGVRVTDAGETYFEFVTLEGHPEAGRIRFSAASHPNEPGALRFEIHSWASSRDGLVAFLYDTVGVGRRVQENTWRLFCERVAEASGGQTLGPVSIETEKHEQPQAPDAQHSA
jgi:hypothetical protein